MRKQRRLDFNGATFPDTHFYSPLPALDDVPLGQMDVFLKRSCSNLFCSNLSFRPRLGWQHTSSPLQGTSPNRQTKDIVYLFFEQEHR